MARSRRLSRSRFTLAVLVAASLTALTLDFRNTAPVRALRSGASAVFSPLQSAGESATKPFRNMWNGATDYDNLKKQNVKLRRQVDRAKGDRMRAAALEKENQALRKIADIKFNGDIPKVGARVLTGPLSNFDREIQIDAGSGDGVKVGMAVVTDAGVVGKVSRVSGGEAQVELITDPAFRMGVRFTEANVVVVARGNGQGAPLVVDGGIKADRPVRKGEVVTTSGEPRSPFPPLVPVGTVRSSQQSKDFAEKSVQINPAADLAGLSYVAVLLYEAPG